MSNRTANAAKSNKATVKSSTSAKSNGRKTTPKAKTQKTMTLHFVPDEKKPETGGTFRKSETGKEQAIGTLYLRKEAAAVLGVDVNSKVKVTIEVEY